MIGDDSVEMVACVGANLRHLNLSNTRFSSAGVGILAGHLPNLEILSLSGTQIDDYAISYMSMMPSLKFIDISNTDIKGMYPSGQMNVLFSAYCFMIVYNLFLHAYGYVIFPSSVLAGFIQQVGAETDLVLSLTALQNLNHLERLNLEQTQVSDATLFPLSTFKELIHLSLRNASLTDVSLHQLSSLSKLTNLSIRDAVLTNSGLGSFKPPRSILIAGALLGRMNFHAWMLFVPLWLTFSYTIGAYSIWCPEGWLAKLGIIDYSGGFVIHLSSGVAGFTAAYWVSGN